MYNNEAKKIQYLIDILTNDNIRENHPGMYLFLETFLKYLDDSTLKSNPVESYSYKITDEGLTPLD